MFFITVPHSSSVIPGFLKNRINSHARLDEITEPGIEDIFHWLDTDIIAAPVHQCFPNVNRARGGINPRTDQAYSEFTALFPDRDFHGTPIFLEGKELTNEEKERLLTEYYDPFYAKIEKHIASRKYDFFIDAHAMNAQSTSYRHNDRYALASRPEICIGNNGDASGDQYEDTMPITFPQEHMRLLMSGLIHKGYNCHQNNPFRGGNIIQTFASRIPCVQIEINKALYMSSDDGDVLHDKVQLLKKDLYDAIISLPSPPSS